MTTNLNAVREPRRREELKHFLRARRERLRPEDMGFAPGARRRTFFDGPGSYGLILDLPKGVELARMDSDDDTVFCFDPDEPQVVNSFPESDLKNADFVCIFQGLGVDESFDFKFTVKITDANANAKGSVTVAAMDNDGYPGVADADEKNNKADITVNGNGSGNLPKTGASLGMVIAGAALVLVAGVVLMVVTARRRKAAAEE